MVSKITYDKTSFISINSILTIALYVVFSVESTVH